MLVIIVDIKKESRQNIEILYLLTVILKNNWMLKNMKDYICTDHGRCIISGWEVASVTLTPENGSFTINLIEIKSIFTLLNFCFFFF